MKVLILTADSNGGYPVPAVKGGAVSTLIEHLAAENNKKMLCDMEILSLYNPEAEKKAREQYSNIKFTWVKVPKGLKLLDKCAFNFIRAVKRNEKIISFRSIFSLLWYIHKARRLVNFTDAEKVVIENNVPLVRVIKGSKYKGQWYYHFHNVPRIDAGCRSEFQKITKFLCVSKYVANQIMNVSSVIGQISSTKLSVFYNCVDMDLFRPIDRNDCKIIDLKAKYGFTVDDFICIFTGRLSEEKGADKLLEAISQMSENVKCLIVGSLLSDFNSVTEYEKKLLRLAEGTNKQVIFTGYVPQIDLPYYYNLADVAVLPSMWEEPAGLTMLEALACGIPVITTDSGGIPEYIGKSGIIIKRDHKIVERIKESIMYFYDSRYENMGKRAVKEKVKKFSKDFYLENFLSNLR